MTKQARTLFLYCEENVHVGAGSSTGTIDLPIQREKHTNLPHIEGSSLRGAIREAAHNKNSQENDFEESNFSRYFGKAGDEGSSASALDITDASLLLFPVRSYVGVFAWITCPLALYKFAHRYNIINGASIEIKHLIPPGDNTALIQKECFPKLEENEVASQVVLEEFLFEAEGADVKIDNQLIGDFLVTIFNEVKNSSSEETTEETESVQNNALLEELKTKIVIVSDDVFRDFTEIFTPKITRNKIDQNTGTAQGMGLFNEEFLPAESILYAFITANDEFSNEEKRLKSDEIIKFAEDNIPSLFKVGGDKNIGKGLLFNKIVTHKQIDSDDTIKE